MKEVRKKWLLLLPLLLWLMLLLLMMMQMLPLLRPPPLPQHRTCHCHSAAPVKRPSQRGLSCCQRCAALT